MFEVDPERSWVDPGAGSITSLIQSLNTPLVAAGQHPAENVQSWILTRGAAGSAAEVFVYFHLTESNNAVLYRWDGGPVPGSSQEQVVEEAMGFCESMGFMMDNLNFSQLPPDKRSELLETLPPFLEDLATLQAKDVEEVPLSINKRVVDPVEEFARARAAMQGQPTANDFGDPNDARSDQFDPMSLMEDVGGPDVPSPPVRASARANGNDVQIEITEIEGLELMPNPERAAVPVKSAPSRMQSGVRELDLDFDEPPLVVGSANIPVPPSVRPAAPTPAPTKAPAPPAASIAPPPTRVRERTPAGDVTIFDDIAAAAATSTAMAPTRAPASLTPAKPVAVEIDDDEFNVDDLLAEVDLARSPTSSTAAPASESALDIDVSSALDDILDGVESSKSPSAKVPPLAPPAAATKPPVPAPAKPIAEDISLDLDMEGSLESSISSPDEALVALEALGVNADDPLAALSAMLDDPPAPAVSERSESNRPPPASASAAAVKAPAPADAPAKRPAVEAAWAEAPKTNGNGSHNGAGGAPPMRLDISTDELARLLSML